MFSGVNHQALWKLKQLCLVISFKFIVDKWFLISVRRVCYMYISTSDHLVWTQIMIIRNHKVLRNTFIIVVWIIFACLKETRVVWESQKTNPFNLTWYVRLVGYWSVKRNNWYDLPVGSIDHWLSVYSLDNI